MDPAQAPLAAGMRDVQDLGCTLHFMPPPEMPAALLDQVHDLIDLAGAVRMRWVRHHLENAFLISLAIHQGNVVGTVTLKRPRPEYLERVKEKTGLELAGHLERGYTAVHPEFRGRGLASHLVRELTRRAEGRPIYTVIAVDNPGALKVTGRAGTRLVATFHSEIKNRQIGIWLQGEVPPLP